MTHMASRFELTIPLAYIETTIPSGVTIDEYRRSRPDGRSWRQWLRVGSRAERRSDRGLAA